MTVRFKAIGSAPILKQQLCKISSNARFEVVSGYLRRVLRLDAAESLCCYVNSAFAPAGDEVVGNLYRVSFGPFKLMLTGPCSNGFCDDADSWIVFSKSG